MERLYNTNEDFRCYVDRFAKHHGISTEEALNHAIVRFYAGYIVEKRGIWHESC